jgi:hypothetical protein
MELGAPYQEGAAAAFSTFGLKLALENGAERLVKLIDQSDDNYVASPADRPVKKLERNTTWSEASSPAGTYGWGSGMATPGGL